MNADSIIAQIRALDPSEPDFYGKQDEVHIATIEQLLDVTIPLSFRSFLIKYGGGDGYTGLYNNKPENMGLGCIVGDNLRAREKYHLSKHFLLFEISPFQELFCLDTSCRNLQGESPVVCFRTERNDSLTHPVVVAKTFEDYFCGDLLSRLEVLQEELD